MARVQKLQEQLRSAQDDLKETEWARSIADQKKLLADFSESYEEYLNQRLDNLESLVLQMVDSVNISADEIAAELRSSAEQVGYTITDGLDGILSEGMSAYYDREFDGITSVNFYLDSINKRIDDMVSAADKAAKEVSNHIDNYPVGESSLATERTLDAINQAVTNISRTGLKAYTGPVTGTSGTGRKLTDEEITAELNRIGYGIWAKYFVSKKEPSEEIVVDSEGNLISSTPISQEFTQDELRTNRIIQEKVLNDLQYRYPDVYNRLRGFSTGGLADYTGLAMLHGSTTRPELVLNPDDTQKFLAAAKLMRTPVLNALADKNFRLPDYRGYGVSGGDVNINLGGISIERVLDYNDFVTQLRDDPKFEKLVRAITVDPMNGKSSFGEKNKIKW